jgi:5-methylcytosine-specific restriction enzyme A
MSYGVPEHQTCALCERQVPIGLITQHHLTPKARGGTAEHKTPMCKPCHKQLHALFTNRELEQQYASIDALKSAETLQPFLKWIRKQKGGRVFRTIDANRRGRRR